MKRRQKHLSGVFTEFNERINEGIRYWFGKDLERRY